jgi:PAS domain S-box-containing protein
VTCRNLLTWISRLDARRRDVAGLIVACAFVALTETATLAQEAQTSVLSFSTTRRDAPAAVIMDRTFERILAREVVGHLDYYAEHIDLTRFGEPAYRTAVRDFLKAKYAGRRFDVIIANGNAALEFVGQYHDELFRGAPVVFASGAGVNVPPGATGLISELNFEATVDIATRIHPDLRRVVVISGASSWDKYYERAARLQFQKFEGRLAFDYLSGLSMPELLRQVATLPRHSIIYFLSAVEDRAGTRFAALDALDMVAEVANAPIYTWHTVGIDHGVVGGHMLSQEVMAARTAELALRVLRGERNIPVASFDPNVNVFDWRQLQRWGIDESRLPPGSTIEFRQPTVWERFRVYIIAGASLVLLQAALIAALLLQQSRRRRTEDMLRESQQRYALATAAGGTGVWDWTLDGDEVYIDHQVKSSLGYKDDEIRNHLPDWLRLGHPDDRPAMMERLRAAVEEGSEAFETEHRMVHKDGSLRWFLARGSVMRDADGKPYRMVGTDTDITERKRAHGEMEENAAALRASELEIRNLAGRLIVAQEAERTRIARELHDDVSQQLAGLCISLSSVRQRLGSPDGRDDVQEAVGSLQRRAIALAESVRQLSHDLHPSVLQHAGLVAALRAHCSEFEQHHKVGVSFLADSAALSLGAASELCLYRVAQEALRNTARHARARHAEVRLTRTAAAVELTVADDGQGFDISHAGRQGAGLGLRSIHERVRQAGGTVSIVAELRRGTTVQVRIPCESAAAPKAAAANTHAPR